MDLLLNPESIRTGSLVLLNIALTVYLLRVPSGSGAPRWLAGFTAGTMALYVCRALEASLFPAPESSVLWWIKLVETLVVIGGLGALLQFAYRFLDMPFRSEARISGIVYGIAGLAALAVATAVHGRESETVRAAMMGFYSLLWIGTDAWAVVLLLRKRRHALSIGDTRSARAFMAFAAVCFADFFILLTITVLMGVASPAVSDLVWVTFVLPGIFLVHVARVAVYVEHAPEPTSLRTKLAGLALALVLGILGMTAVLLSKPINPNIAFDVRYSLEEAQAMHRVMLPLMGVMLGAAATALVAFPLALRGSLVQPVARLLDGVQRVNAGERDVTVTVGVRDEVGRLTEGFNAMTASLRDAEADLRAHAGDLERRVEARTLELATSKAEVEAQAQRLEEMDRLKTRFFANVSHEFRTPLTLLLGPIDDALAGRYGDVGPRLGAQLPVMQRNARRLLDLINQLLDLAKLEAAGLDLNRQPVDLVSLARGVVGTFASRAERSEVALLFESEADALPAALDGPKIEGVLTNILANALAFTKPGGKVRVSVAQEGANAALTITDTGVGIAPADLPHVFDRFRQVDGSATRTHEGTGIGLALAKELVELHGGTISVESTVGFGTQFTVRVPVEAEGADLSEIPASSEAPVTPVPTSNGHRQLEEQGVSTPQVIADDDRPLVLLVEDNADLRAFVRGHLAERYRVVEAADGRAGLEAAREHGPDLVLSDVMMPEMDGITLTRTLKADDRLGDTPVVLLTARADEDSILDGLGAGADDYLSKPFSPAELLARVDNFVTARREMRERYSDELLIGPSQIAVSSAEAAFLEQVRDVVEHRLEDASFGVEALAEAVGLSRRQLGRRMRDALDTSPSAFIRERRLIRAAQLLSQEAGTVSEVAYAVGYRDPEHFSKQFRKRFGTAPSAYRDSEEIEPALPSETDR